MARLVEKDEDAATLALANLMRSNVNALRAFLSLVAPDAVTRRNEWSVMYQHPTKFGRKMDIFIRSNSDDFSIVVEVKVRDVMKTYQFDAYVQHVVSFETGRPPVLVWLVQRAAAVPAMNPSSKLLLS